MKPVEKQTSSWTGILGIFILFCGIGCVGTGLAWVSYGFTGGHGLWSGPFLFVPGILGIIVWQKRSGGVMIAFLTMCIIVIIVSTIQAIITGSLLSTLNNICIFYGQHNRICRIWKDCLLSITILNAIGAALALAGSILGCISTCSVQHQAPHTVRVQQSINGMPMTNVSTSAHPGSYVGPMSYTQQQVIQQPLAQVMQQPTILPQPNVQAMQQPAVQMMQQPAVLSQPGVQVIQQPAVQMMQQPTVLSQPFGQAVVQQPAVLPQSNVQAMQQPGVQMMQQPAVLSQPGVQVMHQPTVLTPPGVQILPQPIAPPQGHRGRSNISGRVLNGILDSSIDLLENSDNFSGLLEIGGSNIFDMAGSDFCF